MKSTASALVGREWNGVAIGQRTGDGYVNATAMAKACGKRWNHYIANDRTQAYVQHLAESVKAETACAAIEAGNPTTGNRGSAGNPADLIQAITTGPNHLRGTWIHPRLAIDFARWLSPAFAVVMDGWFLDWIQGRSAAPAAKIPPAGKRLSSRARRTPRTTPQVPPNTAMHGVSCRLHQLVTLQERKPTPERLEVILQSCAAISDAFTHGIDCPDLLHYVRSNWAVLSV